MAFSDFDMFTPPSNYFEENTSEELDINNVDSFQESLNKLYRLPRKSTTPISFMGTEKFEKAFAQAVKDNPSIAKYKRFLTLTAKKESNFNSTVQNKAGAPYYGYFQMGKDTISETTNLSIEQFRNDPVAQIKAAVKLYNQYIATAKRTGVYDKAKSMGFSDDAIAAGAWLGGIGGVKKFLNGVDVSDSHWYTKAGMKGGTSVGTRMKEFNYS